MSIDTLLTIPAGSFSGAEAIDVGFSASTPSSSDDEDEPGGLVCVASILAPVVVEGPPTSALISFKFEIGSSEVIDVVMVLVVLDIIVAVVVSGRSIAFVVVTSGEETVIKVEVSLFKGTTVVESSDLKVLESVETLALDSSAGEIVMVELTIDDTVVEDSSRFRLAETGIEVEVSLFEVKTVVKSTGLRVLDSVGTLVTSSFAGDAVELITGDAVVGVSPRF